MHYVSLAAALLLLSSAADTATLIDRFLSREDDALMTFVAHRRLEARNDRFNAHGWLEACVWKDAQSGFGFKVINEGGSGLIRGKVLRKALEGERDLVASSEAKGALTSANYEMRPADDTSGLTLGEAAIALRPKRRDVLLLEGRAVVTDPEGDLLRVEGRLAKSPSFWTRQVTVNMRYARIADARVATDMESIADVRIVGKSHFRMRSSFLSVNGIEVGNLPESTRSACLVTQN
jgi:hypothetical protein